MTTRTRKKAGRRRKTGLVYVMLFLLTAAVVFVYLIKGDTLDTSHQVEGEPAVGEQYSRQLADDALLTAGGLVLVNSGHPYYPPAAPALVSIYDHKNAYYFVRDKNVQIAQDVMEPLNALMEAFFKATGRDDINVVSGFRTAAKQQEIYTASAGESGEDFAARYVARPDCSEHHTGLAVDLSIYHADTGTSDEFDGQGKYGWIAENGWQYGFILRYTESKAAVTGIGGEAWHFRYVGVPHARYMKEHDWCLEEYIERLYQYTCDGEHLIIDDAGRRYDVYYCAGSELYVPAAGDYDVSGNNIDGFIVTALVSE